MVEAVRDGWEVIEDALATEHDEGTDVLRPPADEETVSSLEETLDVELPPAFATFLRVHDGQRPNTRPVLKRYQALSASGVRETWERMRDLLAEGAFEGRQGDFDDDLRPQGSDDPVDPEIRDVWYHDKWIPIGTDPGGHLLCLDFAPTDEGTRGQVITYWNDAPRRSCRAPDFETWFTDYAAAIETGEYVYSTETHSLFTERREHQRLSAGRATDPTSEDLRRLLADHHDRPTDENWFLEVCFPTEGRPDPRLQYQHGVVNLAALEPGQRDPARDLLADASVSVVDTGENYVTGEDEGLDAERAATLLERALTEVYETDLDSIVEVRERVP